MAAVTSLSNESSDSRLMIDSDADKPNRHLRYFNFFIALSQLFGFLMLFFTGYLNGTYFDGFQWGNVTAPGRGGLATMGNLNYHATFMTFGLVFLQGEAILMYRMFRHESKTFSKILHTLFHFFAFVLVVFGFVAIVMHKNIRDPPLPHFFSAHSWFGITIIVLFILQYLIGFINFLFPKTSTTVRAWFLPLHKVSGLLMFELASVQALGGQWMRNEIYQFRWPDYGPCYQALNCHGSDYIYNFSSIFLALYAITVVFIVSNRSFARRKTPDEKE